MLETISQKSALSKPTLRFPARRPTVRYLLATVLSGAVLLPACKDQTKLAAVLPLSGESVSYGESVRKGVELAYEELREDSGTAAGIELEIFDSGSDPDQARQMTRTGFDNGAVAILGGITAAEAAAMIEAAEAADRVLLSPSATASALSAESRHFYRLAPSDVVSGNTMADFAFRRLNVESAVTVAENELYSHGLEKGFRPTFEALGGEVLSTVKLADDADLPQVLADAVSQQPDAIYLAAGPATISAAIAELRGLDYEGRILTTQELASPAVVRQTGDVASGVLLTRSAFETNGDPGQVEGFLERFRQKYGEEPDIFAAQGYDALRVLVKATAGRPDLPGEVRKGLRDAVKSFAGVTGTLEFNSQGEVTKYPRVYSVAKNLSLRDHGKMLEEIAEKRRIEIEERRQALAALRQKMADTSSE